MGAVTAKDVYRILKRRLDPVFHDLEYAPIKKASNTWRWTDGKLYLVFRATVSLKSAYSPIYGGRFFLNGWRGDAPDTVPVPFQNEFALNHLLFEPWLEKKRQVRNAVLGRILAQQPAQQYERLILDDIRSGLEAELAQPELWAQDHGLRYLDHDDLQRWADFLDTIFPLLHQQLLLKKRNLADFVGTYVHDPGFEEALKDQRRIDPEMWE